MCTGGGAATADRLHEAKGLQTQPSKTMNKLNYGWTGYPLTELCSSSPAKFITNFKEKNCTGNRVRLLCPSNTGTFIDFCVAWLNMPPPHRNKVTSVAICVQLCVTIYLSMQLFVGRTKKTQPHLFNEKYYIPKKIP